MRFAPQLAVRTFALVLSLSCAFAAWAEGPGSQLRTAPEIPQATPMPTNPLTRDQKRCEELTAQRRQQCLAELRSPSLPLSGPESIGGGAGAATGTGSGTTGGGTFGGSAPR